MALTCLLEKIFLNEVGGFIPEFDKRGDESALFFKAKSKLSKTVSDKIIIHHMQPNSKEIFFAIRNKKWFNTIFI